MPLALSLLAHASVLAALVCFAPLASPPVREAPPVSVRFVPHRDAPAEDLAPPRSSDRSVLPPELVFDPVTIESPGEAEPAEETGSFPGETPAVARRGAIGVGSAGALRVPHPRATAPPATGMATARATAAPPAPAPAVRVLAPAEETTPPVPLACPPPEYPAGAASVSEGGRVRLEIRIASDGRVESVRVLRSSGFSRLDEAAESGVRGWRFRPARRAGQAVAWRLEHTIVFRVDAGR